MQQQQKRLARCNLLWNIQSIIEKIFRLISSVHKFGMWTESQTELLITAEQSNCPNKDIFMKGSSFAHVEPSDSQSSGPSVTLESSKLSCAAGSGLLCLWALALWSWKTAPSLNRHGLCWRGLCSWLGPLAWNTL